MEHTAGHDLLEVLVDVQFRYLFGTEADYLKKRSIIRTENGEVLYDVLHSRTDLLLFSIGASFKF